MFPLRRSSLRAGPSCRRGIGTSAAMLIAACLTSDGGLRAAQTGAAAAPVPRHASEVEGGRLVDAGKHQDGLRVLEQAALAYRRSGDPLGIARTRLKMSTACRALAQFDLAARHARDA